MACPLCAGGEAGPSWLGSTRFHGKLYTYVECRRCASLYCDPMPEAEAIATMYGPEYRAVLATSDGQPEEPDRVLSWLTRSPRGTFVDYGCGSGELLQKVAEMGWTALGVEFDRRVADEIAGRTGTTVATDPEEFSGARADVLHLGDVIEHLTEVDSQMPKILRMLRPGTLLLAQGPLEANRNLFTLLVRLGRTLRNRPIVEMAPYHVSLATARGQRAFFVRFGMKEIEYRVTEVSWPAPRRLTLGSGIGLRSVGLFTLREVSRSISRLRPNRWGNRYFYAGRWPGHLSES